MRSPPTTTIRCGSTLKRDVRKVVMTGTSRKVHTGCDRRGQLELWSNVCVTK